MMKRNTSISPVVLTMLTVCLLSASAVNASYVFQPSPNDLSELPHANFFTWGINFTVPQGEIITSATLAITNIWDWTIENDDHLYIHLLDNPRSGTVSYTDNEGGGDNFAGQGTLVGNWSDPYGGYARNFNLVYDFGALGLLDALNAYAATTPAGGRANFGFGLDPDCHYYNNGVTFTITTGPSNNGNPVPEPATITLMGLAGLSLIRRR